MFRICLASGVLWGQRITDNRTGHIVPTLEANDVGEVRAPPDDRRTLGGALEGNTPGCVPATGRINASHHRLASHEVPRIGLPTPWAGPVSGTVGVDGCTVDGDDDQVVHATEFGRSTLTRVARRQFDDVRCVGGSRVPIFGPPAVSPDDCSVAIG